MIARRCQILIACSFACCVLGGLAEGQPAAGPKPLGEILLELGVPTPQLVFHIDVENDFATLGDLLTRAYRARLAADQGLPPFPIDFARAFGHLGLTQLKSLTHVSIAQPGIGFRSETALRLQPEAAGLAQLFGKENATFQAGADAPADTDIYAELTLNPPLLAELARAITGDILGSMGTDLINSQLRAPLLPDGSSAEQLLQRLANRLTLTARFDEQGIDLRGGLPGRWVIRLRGAGTLLPALMPLLAQWGAAALPDADLPTWEVPASSGPLPFPLLLQHDTVSGDALFAAGLESLVWLRQTAPTLADDPAFARLRENLPAEGTSFWYTSARLAEAQIAPFGGFDFGPNDPAVQVLLAFLRGQMGAQAGATYFAPGMLRATSLHPTSPKAGFATAALSLGISFGWLDLPVQRPTSPTPNDSTPVTEP